MTVRIQGRLSVVVIVLLALLLAAFALPACGSSSGGSGTTSVGSGDTKTYTDADYGYIFEYPTSWKIQKDTSVDVSAGAASTGGVGVLDPKGAKAGGSYVDLMLVSVYKLTVTVDESVLPQLKSEIESILGSLESQGTDMKVEKPLAETTAAGMNGYNVTYSFTKDGTPCTSTLYFLFDGNMEYQLTTQASNENWPTDQPIFDAMIASFKPAPAK
jgi:hypothetical protein